MLQITLPDGSAADAYLILTGPNAGSVRYDPAGAVDPTAGRGLAPLLTAQITGGDPADLRKAAAIMRAQGFWLGPESSMRARRDADRLDDLARGARP